MHETVAASKYARALFEQAKETQQVLACQQGLDEVGRVLGQSPALREILQHPFIGNEEKKRLLHSALGEYATPLLERFLQLLIARHRFSLVPLIVREFQDQVDRYENIEPLRVRTAVALSGVQQRSLKTHLEKWLGAQVRVDWQVDPALIGGLIVQTRDRILDESLKGQLKRLQARLSA